MYYGNFDHYGDGTGDGRKYVSQSGCGLYGTDDGDGYGHEDAVKQRGDSGNDLLLFSGDGKSPTSTWDLYG